MFREAVGESVMRYVTRRKLILAAGEVAETRDTILEIALRYGYDSHEGFTRSFTAYMGMTPTEYRKYHYAVASLRVGKEKRDMMYSKTTDEIIRELNGLIVEARETVAVQEEILLFYLKGEIQKLEAAQLGKGQTDALQIVCDELAGVVKASGHAADEGEEDIPGRLRKVYDEMTA